jgi:sodium/proline symporter
VSQQEAILIGGGVVLLYTLLGGFWAVSVTDTLQGLVMAATAVILPIAAFWHVGGVAAFVDGLQSVDHPGYMNLMASKGWPLGIGAVVGLLSIGLGYPGQPHVVNRFMALEAGDRALRTGQRWAMSWALCVYGGMILLGLCGRIIVSSLGDGEAVFIVLTAELFPSVVAGVFLAAVLSAIMSTADSQLLVAASAVTHDMVGQELRPSVQLARSRMVIVFLSVAAMIAAMYGEESIFKRVLFAWTAMGAAFGPLLLARLRGWPISSARCIAVMVGGAGFAVVAHYGFVGDSPWVTRFMPYVVAMIALVLPVGQLRPQ